MANICTNIAIIYCTNKQVMQNILIQIDKDFDCYTRIEPDEISCEFEFASAASFPIGKMRTLTGKYTDDSLYIQVITYEMPNELLEHHIYEKGRWIDKIAERQINK